ncbi:MAG: 2-amino-4-hydroxy-6-hydroxymethyldihydropteridine diphosphokinase [Bacteroidota bacterium]
MEKDKQQYFIALGSNINPESNIINMIEALFELSEVVDISEIMRTEPVGLKSEKYFLNTVVRIETDKDRPDLKNALNTIEESLGRDRSNPERKYRDRTADLDILFALPLEEKFADKTLFEEEGVYIVNPLMILLKYLDYQTNMNYEVDDFPRVRLHYKNAAIGHQSVQLKQQLTSK